MNINRQNYESYLVDYVDGTLAPEWIPQMEEFLKQNPNIQEEMDLYTGSYIKTDETLFPEKQRLKQIPLEKSEPSSDYFQRYCVAYIEGWLTENEQAVFEASVKKNAAKTRELNLFRKTILPEDAVVFDEKILLMPNESNPNISNLNFEAYCIGCVEGWLNQNQMVALNAYLEANPEKQQTLTRYQKIKLVPDYSIIYPDKQKIKRFNIFNTKTRKVLSYVASSAAVIVFGMMVYYSSTFDQKEQLAGHIGNPQKVTVITEKIEPLLPKQIENNQPLLPKTDLFGFKKLQKAADQAAELEASQQVQTITHMQPIQLAALDCADCKEVFIESKTLNKKAIPQNQLKTTDISDEESREEQNTQAADKTLVKELAQVGLSQINNWSNGKLIIEKSSESQKTKIALNTRYFAVSTQVKNRKK
ncbi:MAG: hypothetical protein CVU09_15090 [Bacteroidetes bacterium HGW-Bacteroidetes-4]|jgi:hypothetical protein|nr:MAG: hypothetical protein CVU09_15090 [Bacteroidetes bacterium HGW-Bacteroidetes-4]